MQCKRGHGWGYEDTVYGDGLVDLLTALATHHRNTLGFILIHTRDASQREDFHRLISLLEKTILKQTLPALQELELRFENTSLNYLDSTMPPVTLQSSTLNDIIDPLLLLYRPGYLTPYFDTTATYCI